MPECQVDWDKCEACDESRPATGEYFNWGLLGYNDDETGQLANTDRRTNNTRAVSRENGWIIFVQIYKYRYC